MYRDLSRILVDILLPSKWDAMSEKYTVCHWLCPCPKWSLVTLYFYSRHFFKCHTLWKPNRNPNVLCMCICDFIFFVLCFMGRIFLCMLQHVFSGPTCGNSGNRPKAPQGLPRCQTALYIIRESFKGTCTLGYNYINGSVHPPPPPPKKNRQSFCSVQSASLICLYTYIQCILYCGKSYNGKQVNRLSK